MRAARRLMDQPLSSEAHSVLFGNDEGPRYSTSLLPLHPRGTPAAILARLGGVRKKDPGFERFSARRFFPWVCSFVSHLAPRNSFEKTHFRVEALVAQSLHTRQSLQRGRVTLQGTRYHSRAAKLERENGLLFRLQGQNFRWARLSPRRTTVAARITIASLQRVLGALGHCPRQCWAPRSWQRSFCCREGCCRRIQLEAAAWQARHRCCVGAECVSCCLCAPPCYWLSDAPLCVKREHNLCKKSLFKGYPRLKIAAARRAQKKAKKSTFPLGILRMSAGRRIFRKPAGQELLPCDHEAGPHGNRCMPPPDDAEKGDKVHWDLGSVSSYLRCSAGKE